MKATVKDKENGRKMQRVDRGLRMREVTKATGLPKSAVLHYVAQGLLPEPVRTGPNMAYYDPSCIERIRFIKAMQSAYSFPLSKIKVLLHQKDEGKDVAPLIELSETIFEKGDAATISETEFCSATGLSHDQVKELMGNSLLLPIEQGNFNRHDVAIGKIYAGGFAVGITVSDLAFYGDAAKRIVDSEMRLRQRITGHLPQDQDAGLTKELVHAARAVRNYVIDRVFQQRVASAQDLKDERLTS